MKTFISDTFGRWLILGSVVVVLLACVVGFSVDARGYLGNVLAEVAGVFISVLFALLIVERFVQYQRQKQWARVRNLTYQAIAAHLCDLASDMSVYFPIRDLRIVETIPQGRDYPNPHTPNAMTALRERLRSLPASVSCEQSTSDIGVEYYEEVKWDINQIRDVLIPRLIESSDEQDLIDALVEFDDAARGLHNAIIAHERVVTHGVFAEILNLLDKARIAYSVLLTSWTDAEDSQEG